MSALIAALLVCSASANDAAPTRFRFAAEVEGPLDCAADPCADVLPAAAHFEEVDGKPYRVGLDDAGGLAGWVAVSTDVTDRTGYSGKPLVTLVGIGPDARFTGAEVLHHSEPILLVGIPEQALVDFVGQYAGRAVDDPITVGGHGSASVDAISGATVTVLAENATILETGRRVAADVGVVSGDDRVPGHFVERTPWTWKEITHRGALGHLVVTRKDMGFDDPGEPYADIWFGIADPPQIGIPLLGAHEYDYAVSQLKPGEHLFVVLNSGTGSFRGSGFVRGGIFDRIRVEQGLRTILFRDMDHTRIGSPPVPDAPHFREAALFVARGDDLDPGGPYRLVLLASRYDGRGGFSRDFETFAGTHRVPRSVYVLDGPDPETAVWKRAWATGWPKVLAVGLYLLGVVGLFAARRWTTGRMPRLKRVHTTVLITSFLFLGLLLHVQPSVTQVLTVANGVKGQWDWGLFLSDPVLFVSWIFIAVVTVIWGRGVFCGWVCPYGAMTELLFELGRRLKLPEIELGDRAHRVSRTLRYAVFAVLLATFLVEPAFGETLAEVEPFKSTFFVPFWTRHAALIAWWLVLVGASLVWYRPFCRYVCPLGAALAVGSSVRISGPHRRDFCTRCKICTRGCEPRAIRSDGTIDPRECLSCMECEANWRDDQVCPPLVRARREREGSIPRRLRKTA